MYGLFDLQREHDACGIGFVAHLEAGRRGQGLVQRQVVSTALSAMARLAHRGGHNPEEEDLPPQALTSGDGAGLLLPLPREFFRRHWPLLRQYEGRQSGLPWAVGQLFLPQDSALRNSTLSLVTHCLSAQGCTVQDGRDVPVHTEVLHPLALASAPCMQQIVVVPTGSITRSAGQGGESAEDIFERRLYVARRCMEKAVRKLLLDKGHSPRLFHVASLSCRSVVYKALLPGVRLANFYPDLQDEDFGAPFAIFHERFSTNTMPAWPLVQPFRHIAHNGEINTIKGNVQRMKAREAVLSSPLFGKDMDSLLPVIDAGGSDSAMFDNTLELLVRGGRSMPHALMMMVPEPFGQAYIMGDNKRAFYEYHAALMEPWDGPTAMVFTDGHARVGALLDRNGLRPCRYSVSPEGLVVLASETGVVDTVVPERDAEEGVNSAVQRRQLQPRRMIMVDVEKQRMVPDAEIKGQVIRARPYRRWLRQCGIGLDSLHLPETATEPQISASRKALFGYTESALNTILVPMVRHAQEPVEAMGYDLPLAVLLDGEALHRQPCSLFDYFKQQFAQVTNPPIDSQREELSMSLMSFVGREGNLLDLQPDREAGQCGLLRLQHPFLLRSDMARLRAARHERVRCVTLDATYDLPAGHGFSPAEGGRQMKAALHRVQQEAEDALKDGATLLVISDTGASIQRAPLPALLCTAALHQHLLRRGLRHACGIIVETGEAWEIMHMALLLSYGASALCPYMALGLSNDFARTGLVHREDHEAEAHYVAALKKGLLKTMARLGISTLRSYRGGQSFEAVGLGQELVESCFSGTVSRLGGIGFAELAEEAARRQRRAMEHDAAESEDCDRVTPRVYSPSPSSGQASVPRLWSKRAVRALHELVQTSPPRDALWQAYAACSDVQPQPVTLRHMLTFRQEGFSPVPLEEVEGVESIVRRFLGAAMSLGSLSTEAHSTIAVAFNRWGACSNSGEGGEDRARDTPLAPDRDQGSRVRQIASGRFGVTAEYLARAQEIQIKMAQGAKPGEGGQLPAHKVTVEIARVRHTLPHVSLISPPPHHDIYSIEDLAQLIFDLRRVQPTARISVKLVAESGVGTVAVGVAKAGADAVLISGHDGGTGASPLSAVQHTGLPWEMGLCEVRQALEASGLRQRIQVQVDGQLRTGRDIVMAACMGAEEFGLGTSLLVAMGCVMCRKCHLGKCPVGIATQEAELRRNFKARPEDVERFLLLLAEDSRRHMAALGFRRVEEMVGRVDMLEARREGLSPKARTLDLSALLYTERRAPDGASLASTHSAAPSCPRSSFVAYGNRSHTPPPESALEEALHRAAEPVLSGRAARCACAGTVCNRDRAVGTRLSGMLARQGNRPPLEDHSITLSLRGSAGQSLGAFLTKGITIDVRGDANDYVGKGLSGGIVVVAPPQAEELLPLGVQGQSLVGNVALYGATSGQAFIAGMAGERFAVRNSGAVAVVEGLGDHGCEYMTGGIVVVLGNCGYNFAAGMSGGVAFVYDGDERFQNRCNTDSVDMESVWRPEDTELLRHLLEQHLHYTGSVQAAALLSRWDAALSLFVKVVPLEYAESLQRLHGSVRHGTDTQATTEEVFVPLT